MSGAGAGGPDRGGGAVRPGAVSGGAVRGGDEPGGGVTEPGDPGGGCRDDRRGSAPLRVAAAGVAVEVTGLPNAVRAHLRHVLGALVDDVTASDGRTWAAGSGRAQVAAHVDVARAGDGWAVCSPGRDGETRSVVPDEPASLRLALTVASAVNGALLAGTPHLAVHAGVVAHDGAALAVPAVSGAGKSTLVGAAVRAGADYVSDEALVVDRDSGEVLPYAKPLGLDAWSRGALGLAVDVPPPRGLSPDHDDTERLVPVAALVAAGPSRQPVRTGARRRPLRLRHVVLPRRGAAATRLSPVPRSQAVVLLLEQAFNHFHDPRGSFRLAVALARGSEVWALDLRDGDADGLREAGERLYALLRERGLQASTARR